MTKHGSDRNSSVIRRVRWAFVAVAMSALALALSAGELSYLGQATLDDLTAPSRGTMSLSLPAKPRFYLGDRFVPSMDFDEAQPYDPPHADSLDEGRSQPPLDLDTDEIPSTRCRPSGNSEHVWDWTRFRYSPAEGQDSIPGEVPTSVGHGERSNNDEKMNDPMQGPFNSTQPNLAGNEQPAKNSMIRRKQFAEEDKVKARTHLLIVVHTKYENSTDILSISSVVNKAYAKRWGHDLVVIRDRPSHQEANASIRSVPCEPYEGLSMNPLLLSDIARAGAYDQVLVLSANIMLRDFDVDVTSLLSQGDHLFATHDAPHGRGPRVVLWNVRHPLFLSLVEGRLENSRNFVSVGDDAFPQQILRTHPQTVCDLPYSLFTYGNETAAKHFLRSPARLRAGSGDVISSMKSIAEKVCKKYAPACQDLVGL